MNAPPPRILPLLLLAAALCGCASAPKAPTPEAGAPPEPFSRIANAGKWVMTSELPEGDPVRVALLDLDLSQPEVSFRYAPASFVPTAKGRAALVAEEAPAVLHTAGELRDRLEPRVEDTPIGILVAIGGERPEVDAEGEEADALSAFLADFVEHLDGMQIPYALLVPESIRIRGEGW